MNATPGMRQRRVERVTRPAAAADHVLTAEALRCAYGDFEAVRGVDLAVRRGELFALLGTNGAGKTTMLETLEGHRRPTAGTVRVLGRDPHRHRRRLAGRLGVMFQDSALPDELTPAELLRVWERLTPGAHGPGWLDDHLDRVGLAHRRNVPAGRLSGGERRRLDLAVALSTGPEVVFLDEPTTGLDPQARVRPWEVIRELLAAGSTVLLTTHYLEEAEALADRLAILHAGRVAVSGTLDEVLAGRPARIRCSLPPDVRVGDLTGTVGTAELTARHGDTRLTLATPALQRDLTLLLAWADRAHVLLRRLRVSEPSLGDVFHEIRDHADVPEDSR